MEFFDLYDRKYKKFSEMDDESETESVPRKESKADSVPDADGTYDTNAEPELHLKSKSGSESKHRTESKSGSESKHRTESKSGSESKHRMESKSESESKHRKESKSEAESEHRTESKSEAESEHRKNSESKTEPKHRRSSESKSESKHRSKSESKTESKHRRSSESKSESKHRMKSGSKTEPKHRSKSEPKPDTESKAAPEVKPELGSKPEPIPATKPESALKPDVRSDQEAESSVEITSASDSVSGSTTTSTPDLVSTSESETTFATELESKSDSTVDSVLTPEPESQPESTPEPEPESKTNSTPKSTVEPDPAPKSEPKSDSIPESTTESAPEPEGKSEPEPDSSPASAIRKASRGDSKASRRDGKASRRDQKKSRRDRGESGEYGESGGNKVGKIIVCIQIVLSVIFLILLHLTSLFDTQIFLAVLATLAVFAVVFGLLQFFKKRFLQILGIVLSIIVSLVLLLGNYYLFRVNQTANAITGADSSTVQMIVVVPIDDPAETLEDAADYVFGYQYTTDTDNMDSMIESMESEIGNFEKQEYDSVMDVAEAVLDGEIGAGILNSAFVDLIEDEISNFSDKVKVIYSQTFTYAVLDDETAVSDDSIFNVLISGIDTDGDISKTSRSDVNIIMTVNMNTKKILMTTTPRDYYVEIPGISGGELDKLTHSGLYGVEATMDTLEELYGIEIDYYIRVNFTSLVNVVDALGGVTVDSDYAFETTGGAYSFVEGENFLDGEAALAFSRERYAFSDGDNQRGKNQEAVLTGILEELTSPSALRNANELLDTMIGFVQTNMEKEQLMELVGTQLLSQGDWTFERQAATGTGDSQPTYSGGSVKRYVMWPDEDIVAALANRMQLVLEGK